MKLSFLWHNLTESVQGIEIILLISCSFGSSFLFCLSVLISVLQCMFYAPATVGGPPKSSYRSGLVSAATAKGRRSSSPLPSPPERSDAAVSPSGIGNTTKTHAGSEDVMPYLVKSKESISSSDKEIPSRATSVGREMQERRGNFGPKPTDLQSLLISLLKENPKGMSLKASTRV